MQDVKKHCNDMKKTETKASCGVNWS